MEEIGHATLSVDGGSYISWWPIGGLKDSAKWATSTQYPGKAWGATRKRKVARTVGQQFPTMLRLQPRGSRRESDFRPFGLEYRGAPQQKSARIAPNHLRRRMKTGISATIALQLFFGALVAGKMLTKYHSKRDLMVGANPIKTPLFIKELGGSHERNIPKPGNERNQKLKHGEYDDPTGLRISVRLDALCLNRIFE